MTVMLSVLGGAGLAAAVVAGVLVGAAPRAADSRGDELPVVSSDVDCTPPARGESALETRRLLFREDEQPSRVVAEVTATLVRDGEGSLWLRFLASATGSQVDPAPGWEGVAGVNRITAEEMGALLRS